MNPQEEEMNPQEEDSDLPTRRFESKLADLAERICAFRSAVAFVGKSAFHRQDQAKLKVSFTILNH